MRKTILVMGIALLVATTYGTAAYTTGYADRTATIDVVADSTALIGLEDGNSGDIVGDTGGSSNDQLVIDFSNTSASGANADGYFELGDPANGNSTYAFNITNNGADARTLTLNYTLDTDDGNGEANVTFEVYDSSNNQVLTADDESTGSSSTDGFASGETVHVVVKVDTTGLDSNDDLSGTLRVKLN